MDISRRELPLKLLNFTSLSSSLLFLLITFGLLLGLTDLRSNLHSIHLNQVTSVFVSQLVFLLSIDRTQNQSVCKLAAILLHYCCMCSLCWMLVEELHVYRMLTETRNINHRHMTFYYAIGWGVPAVITGLSVGLDPGGFGSSEFCWLSVQDSVLWTIAGPVSAVLTVTMVMFVLAVKQSVGQKQLIAATAALSSSPWSAILLVLLLSASWLSGLMAVNSDVISFHYLFSVLSCLQGVCFFFFYCVFSRELRRNLKELFIRKKSGRELRNNHAAALTRSLNRKQSFPGGEGLYRTTIGESMPSLSRKHSGLNCPPSSGSIRKCFHDNNNSLILTRKQFRKESCSSDSSSDASLHSSDCEDEHLRNNQREEEKDSTTLQGPTLSNHVRPYWQVEPPTAADSERLSEGGRVVEEVNQLNNQSVAENEALHSKPDGSQQPMRMRGILKMRTPPHPPPPTVANRKYLLSECPAPYSPSNHSLRQVAGGNRVLVNVIPPSTLLQTRPPLSPRQQFSGVTKVTRTRLMIVGGSEDEHESACSDETLV